MVEVKHPGAFAPDQLFQHGLSLDQRERAQVLSVEEQQIDAMKITAKKLWSAEDERMAG
jgi:hypothetical protein